jgi:hypothetical protein
MSNNYLIQGIGCLVIGNNHLLPSKLCPLTFVQGEPKVHVKGVS